MATQGYVDTYDAVNNGYLPGGVSGQSLVAAKSSVKWSPPWRIHTGLSVHAHTTHKTVTCTPTPHTGR